jgi:hypothetical protein
LYRDRQFLRLQDLPEEEEKNTRERPETFLWSRLFAETG